MNKLRRVAGTLAPVLDELKVQCEVIQAGNKKSVADDEEHGGQRADLKAV